jgi:hypothetical protein
MENTPQSPEFLREICDIKKKKKELDARRNTLAAERHRIELEWKLLDDDYRIIQEKISDIIEANVKNFEIAPECVLGVSIPDGGKVFEEYIDPIEEIVAPIEAAEKARKGTAPYKVVKYSEVNQKKQIKTLLHTILELTNEKGKVKLKDIAKEIDVDENTLNQWAKVMDKRGMVRVSSSIRGEVFIEKMPYHATPHI